MRQAYAPPKLTPIAPDDPRVRTTKIVNLRAQDGSLVGTAEIDASDGEPSLLETETGTMYVAMRDGRFPAEYVATIPLAVIMKSVDGPSEAGRLRDLEIKLVAADARGNGLSRANDKLHADLSAEREATAALLAEVGDAMKDVDPEASWDGILKRYRARVGEP